ACSKLTASHIWRRWSLNRFDQQRRLASLISVFVIQLKAPKGAFLRSVDLYQNLEATAICESL
ncbi:hypothetical protein, partial [Vibrio splendidus]